MAQRSGRFSTVAISLETLLTISFGVLAGAQSPYHVVDSGHALEKLAREMRRSADAL